MGNNEKTPKTGMVLQVAFYIGTDIFFPLLIFSDCFSLVLHLARVNATTGSMRRYLDPTEVAQAVQLLQDGTSICTIARRFVVSHSAVSKVWRRFQESSYSRRAGHGRRRSLTHQQEQDEHCQSPTKWPPAGHWCECLWPNNQKQTSWGWPEGQTSSIGPFAHCPAPWSSIGICHWTPELAGPPLAPCAFHRWEQVHPEHMWKGLEMPWRTLCCL